MLNKRSKWVLCSATAFLGVKKQDIFPNHMLLLGGDVRVSALDITRLAGGTSDHQPPFIIYDQNASCVRLRVSLISSGKRLTEDSSKMGEAPTKLDFHVLS